MMYLKECPKCYGDLVSGEDAHGRYLSCIQCGYMRDELADDAHALAGKAFVIDAPKTVKKRQKKARAAA